MLPESNWLAQLAIDQLVQVTLVALVMGLLVRLVARQRPQLAYLLWLLVIVKCLTPPLMSSPTSAFSWYAARQTEPAVSVTPADITRRETVAFVPAPSTTDVDFVAAASEATPPPLVVEAATRSFERFSWPAIALTVWCVGAAALAAYVVAGWIRLRRSIRAATVETPERASILLDQLAARLGIRRVPRMVVTSSPLGPCTLGWPRSTIVVPQALVDQSSANSESILEHVLAHELLHVARGDLAIAWLQLVAQIVWWFHPCIWWANREARRERERCCDEAVLARLSYSPARYASTLVAILELRHRLAASLVLPIASVADVNERRLRHIMRPLARFNARTPRWCWGILAIAALAVLPGAGLSFDEPMVTETAADDSELNVDQGAFGPRHRAAVARLKRLGAHVDEGVYAEGDAYCSIQFGDSNEPDTDESMIWRGTADDMRLVVDLEHLRRVTLVEGTPELAAQVPVLKGIDNVTSLDLRDPTAEVLRAVGRIDQLKYMTIMSNGRPGYRLSSDDYAPLAGLEQLEQLSVYGMPLDDDALAHLGRLPKLKQLALDGLPISDRGIESLRGLNRLEYLDVRKGHGENPVPSRVSGTGIAQLSGLPALRHLSIEGPQLSDDGLRAISKLEALESLFIREATNTTAVGVEVLQSLTSLRSLVLDGPALADDDFAPIGHLTRLQFIWLGDNVDLGDEAMSHLAALTDLQQFEAPGQGLTEQGVAVFAGMTRLYQLNLPQAQITPAGIEMLAKLSRLVSLTFDARQLDDSALTNLVQKLRLSQISLHGSKITDDGLAALGTNPRIRSLDLSDTAITDKALDHVARLPKLSTLNLSGTAITDAGLAKLHTLKTLEVVDISGTQVSAKGVEQLAAALPKRQSLHNDFDSTLDAVWLDTGGLEVLLEEADQRVDEPVPQPNNGAAIGAEPGWVPVELDFVGEPPAGVPAAGALDKIQLEVVGRAVAPGGTLTSVELHPDEESRDKTDEPQPRNENEGDAESDDKFSFEIGVVPDSGPDWPFSQRHQLAAAELRRLGATVDETVLATPRDGGETFVLTPDFKGDRNALATKGEVVVTLTRGWKGSPDDLQLIADLDDVRQVQLWDIPPELDAQLGVLSELKDLNWVDLQNARREALRQLAGLKQLHSLLLYASGEKEAAQLSADDLAPLAEMSNLRWLSLSQMPLDDAALRQVARLTNLETLRLEHLLVSDDGLAALAPLKRLRELVVVDGAQNAAAPPRITGAGLAALRDLPALADLTIVATGLNDKGMQAIGSLANLRHLQISEASKINAAGMRPLAALTKLERLVLAGPTLSGDDFPPLAELKELYSLVLHEDTDLGDAGARHIAGLTKLRQLDVRGAGLTDEGIAVIAGLPELRYLSIPGAHVSPEGLDRLVRLDELEVLEFDARRLGNAALDKLVQIPKLSKNRIALPRAQLTDDGLAALEKCPDLQSLDLELTPITDAGLDHVVRLSKLTSLDLGGTQMTDAGLAKLHAIKSLKYLDVRQTTVTKDALERLAAALPDLQWLGNDAGYELPKDTFDVPGLVVFFPYDGAKDDPKDRQQDPP